MRRFGELRQSYFVSDWGEAKEMVRLAQEQEADITSLWVYVPGFEHPSRIYERTADGWQQYVVRKKETQK